MLSAALRTRLEKTAHDNGFELHLPPVGDWLAFASSQTRLEIWLAVNDVHAEKRLLVAVSQKNVAQELQAHAATEFPPLPPGARSVLFAPNVPALDRLLLRVFQLSITLPDELLHHLLPLNLADGIPLTLVDGHRAHARATSRA